MSTTPRNWLLRYGSALIAACAAWLAHLLLDDALAGHAPYAIFILAIAFAARFGGAGPALLAIGFGALASARSFLPPPGSFAVHGAEYQIGMAMYLAVGFSVAFLGQAMRILRTRVDTFAEEARHQQAQVAQESTGRQPAEKAMAVAEERLLCVLDSIPTLIAYVDARGCYQLNNRAYERWFGHSRNEIAGKHLREVLGDSALEAIRPYVESALAGQPVSYESVVPYKDAGVRYIHADYIPQVSQEGESLGFVALVQDITEGKRMEAALRESEARLRLAAEGARVGFWFWDVSTNRLEWTPMCKRLFGIPPDQEVTYPMFLDRVVPEDRDKLQALGEQVLEQGDDFAMEYRTRWPDGSIHWIYALGRPEHTSDRKIRALSGVAIDITERKQAEEFLREADRRKDEFLATLAHELRNPLAPVRHAVHIMRALGPEDEKLQWARDVIDRQVEQMARLVDDLLDVSRITRGKIQLRKERLALADVVTCALETSRPLVESSGHTLTVSLPPEPLQVDADATRLAQVLANLLNNAAKYTEEGGHIWLAVERDEGHAVLRVRDNGVGIPRDMLPRIFDMFTQVDRSLERAQGGLGIGLTLVQKLVEMHGGTVAAHSDGPGQGSELLVRLPLAVEHEAHAPGEVMMEAPEEMVASCCRVLVIDDNEDSAETLGLLLEVKGHEVHVAFSGHQALETARAVVPDVVLLDIGLPDISGYEVARRMRQQPALKDVVLIAQTGWGQEEDRRQSQAAGFDHHLVKPIDLDALRALLADIGSSLASSSGRADRAGACDAIAGATAPAAGSTGRG